MSKDLKNNNNINVEIVENLLDLLSWISSTIVFWKMDNIFPTNLIKKCCDDFYIDIEKILTPLE